MYRVVEFRRVEGDANSNQGVHLIVLLRDAIELRVLLEVLGPRNID